MIKKFIDTLPLFHRLVFLAGKFFNKIGNSILSYKELGSYFNRYNKLSLKNVEISADGDLALYKYDGLQAYARVSSSDSMVFNQVIVGEEYKPVTDIFLLNNLPLQSFLDLGSNVGFTSLYIKKIFPDCMLIALEPDKTNFTMIEKNFKLNQLLNVFPIMGGVGKKDCFLKPDEGIRDKKEWSFSFTEVDYPTDIASYSVNSLLSRFSLNQIDLIKMDVEGAEKEIFAADADISFLDKVNVLAVEIHDEFNIRSSIYDILKQKNFVIFNTGETTIAVKRNLLNN